MKKPMMIIENFPSKKIAIKSLNSTIKLSNPFVNTLISKIIP
jgi:hypothetical protein